MLYKYLPAKYISAVLDNGEILFRNLTYFQQHEGKVRGDLYEGIHVDYPETDIVLKNNAGKSLAVERFSFLNSINPDTVFAFCLSKRFSKNLMNEFECDSCIEIFKPNEFIRRVRYRLASLISVHKVGLLAQSVHYYHPIKPAPFDTKNPIQIAFAKNEFYKDQEEFRLCFGTRQSFKLTQKIVLPQYNPHDEALKGQCKEKLIKIGALNDIANVIRL